MAAFANDSGNVSTLKPQGGLDPNQIATHLCQLFFASHGIPIACWRGQTRIASSGFPSDITPDAFVLLPLRALEKPFTTHSTHDDAMFGYVRSEALGLEFVIGPTFPLGRQGLVLEHFMNLTGIPVTRREEVAPLLARIPRYTFIRFSALVGFFHLLANNASEDPIADITDHDAVNDVHREASRQQDSFSIEQSMLVRNDITRLVREGAVDEIWSGLGTQTYHDNLVNELSATMGNGNLRMAKDEFIVDATETFLHGAIPGGIGTKLGLQMLSAYVAKCEEANSEVEVVMLLNAMLMDVATIVNSVRTPSGISPEVHDCIKIVVNNLANVPTIEELAHRIGCSTSFLTKHFKEETGLTINQYVRYRRMDEAKRLLHYTKYSLSEISALLGFSSQPYFANTFKRECGITPKQYRLAVRDTDEDEDI
jgi:AraC-like DNA-binding protein